MRGGEEGVGKERERGSRKREREREKGGRRRGVALWRGQAGGVLSSLDADTQTFHRIFIGVCMPERGVVRLK